jgi:uncharacterized membrane protein YgcG
MRLRIVPEQRTSTAFILNCRTHVGKPCACTFTGCHNCIQTCCGFYHAGVQARARQGNASSAVAEAISSDAVLAALADSALNIVGRFDNTSSSSETADASAVGRRTGSNGSGSSGGGNASPSVFRQRAAGLGSPSAKAQQLMVQLQEFMQQHVYPAEATFDAHAHGPNR